LSVKLNIIVINGLAYDDNLFILADFSEIFINDLTVTHTEAIVLFYRLIFCFFINYLFLNLLFILINYLYLLKLLFLYVNSSILIKICLKFINMLLINKFN